ncbi:MAG: ABC transporter substrate-binding protein [Advenella sp.]
MKRRSFVQFFGLAALGTPLVSHAQDSIAGDKTLVSASQSEPDVLIYSNLPNYVWKPFRDLLGHTYPWIKLATTDMGAELWERYFAESAAGTRTADIITTTAPDRIADFIDRGEMMPYVSTQSDALPAWSRPETGLYTISASPAILMYNRFLVKEPPQSIRDIVAMANDDPKGMRGRISTYDAAANPFGTAMFATWLRGKDNDWPVLEPIGPLTRPETGTAVQREKLMTGEYKVAFFSSSVSLVALERPEVKRLVGWDYIKDGTMVALQGALITKRAKSPNSAKLVMDLMLSREGQRALATSGMTPYRSDIEQAGLPFNTLQTVRDKIGEENLIYYNYDRKQLASWPQVVEKWKSVFKAGR